MASNEAVKGHRSLVPGVGNVSAKMEHQQQTGSNQPKRNALGEFPEPMIFLPQLKHRHTIIVLHGRGSFAAKFAPPLLEATVDSHTLQTAFPHAKFIFPTASKNKATIYKNATHQWFDSWHLSDYTKRQHLMVDGLHKSCGYIHRLLREEIQVVGKENVVLWGLSQGCATSLVSLLTWDGEPFAAVVGMCGWLPYGNELERFAGGRGEDRLEEDENEDAFARSEDSDNEKDEKGAAGDLPSLAVSYLRDMIDLDDKTGVVFQKIPVFLGHGTEDESVPINLGREAKTCLELMYSEVQMKEYEGLGHWYSEDMLRDIFQFIKERLKGGGNVT